MKKIYKIKVNNKAYEVELEEVKEIEGNVVSSTPSKEVVEEKVTSGSGESVTAPMPGAIFDIKVSVGSQVKEGDVVAVLEAMKMETEIFATTSGSVTAILKNKGDQVVLGDVILSIN